MKYTISDDVRERAWDVISTVRDASPRDKEDASTDDIIDALVQAGLIREELNS